MSLAWPEPLEKRVASGGLIAVLTVDDAGDAVPLARALLDGGVDAMELTLRTPVALEALRRIVAEVPEMGAGVGTILTPDQADAAKAAGAAFGVSPGVNPRVLARCAEIGLPFAPGIVTPSDIEAALEHGCRILKFFPCEPSGGLPYLTSMVAPYRHLGVRFIPLGGVGPANLATYLDHPDILAVGGSWLAKPAVIEQRDWPAVTTAAREAREIAAKARP
ncbi:MAG: bifunctional 4-hydroxy-2-oxoglutarate aldolase/2-dehydro-3-deoxy-phosphogluconate aldolase [Opitutales bacterium]